MSKIILTLLLFIYLPIFGQTLSIQDPNIDTSFSFSSAEVSALEMGGTSSGSIETYLSQGIVNISKTTSQRRFDLTINNPNLTENSIVLLELIQSSEPILVMITSKATLSFVVSFISETLIFDGFSIEREVFHNDFSLKYTIIQ